MEALACHPLGNTIQPATRVYSESFRHYQSPHAAFAKSSRSRCKKPHRRHSREAHGIPGEAARLFDNRQRHCEEGNAACPLQRAWSRSDRYHTKNGHSIYFIRVV